MFRAIAFLLALLLATVVGTANAGEAAQAERELLKAEAALCHAYQISDAATLRDMLEPDYTLTSTGGKVTGRDQDLAEAEQRDPAYETFRNHDQKVRLYGNMALVNGITSVRGVTGGKAFTADFQYTDTWIYRDGRWKLAASHATRLQPN